MSSPERVQDIALLDHRDAPAFAPPLLDPLEPDRPKQTGRYGQHAETPEEDVFIPAASSECDCLVEQSSAQPLRPGRRIDQQPAQLSISLGMADDRDAADERCSLPPPFYTAATRLDK
jgi:hypothetical protein